MKQDRKKRLHSYVTFLLVLCIFLGLSLDDSMDFWTGFFAGWNKIGSEEEAKRVYGDLSQVLGWVSTGGILILVSVCSYGRLRKKVTEPIEQLAKNMGEVSGGDLAVRSPEDGGFEISDIQKAFNSMVEELENGKKAREIAEQKNQQLYAGIAHDLKTPMTMIMGYAKLLEQGNAPSEEEKMRYIRTIIEQTEHTNKLLDSLLAYTKLQNQSYQLKKEKRDLVECLRESVANLYPMLEAAQVRMELLLPEREILWEFDHVEMKRVFTNLLTNMVKHNPPKTACVIQLEEVTDQEQGGRKIRITFADDGPKIPKDLQDNMFDSFVVGDESRNTKHGSGLGLSISKKIMERHDGCLYYADEWKPGYKSFRIEIN